MALQIQRGKKQETLSDAAFDALLASYESMQIDLGTGDGRFVLREAREQPNRLCIGLDATGDNLKKTASSAMRKPVKGGAPNALYLVAPVEKLPEVLLGKADRVTVNFPWGSLLQAVVEPVPRVLSDIVALAKPGAALEFLINYHVFNDPDYLERLGLQTLDDAYLEETLLPAYDAAGIVVHRHTFLKGDSPHRTTWGQRLIKGSGRETLLIFGNRADGESANDGVEAPGES